MRHLSLIRHAKSSWDQDDLSDIERPLNSRGRRDAPDIARRVASMFQHPLRIVSSPALRAIVTAHAFADVLGIGHHEILIEPRIYEATSGTLLELVRSFDDADTHVALFGHNPGLTDLSLWLGECPFRDMPTCAVAQFAINVSTWSEVNPGDGILLSYRFPKECD